MSEKTISFEALALSSIMVTKHLISAVIGAEKLSNTQMQAVFEAAKRELQRFTLSVGPKEADEMLSLLWSDYIPPAVDPETH